MATYSSLPKRKCSNYQRLEEIQSGKLRLTRSSLHRCLQRHGLSRLPDVEGDKPNKHKFKAYPIGYFHINIVEVRTEQGNDERLRRHLGDFVAAYNFGRRLKTLKGLTPNEFICKIWTKEPERFNLNPTHQMPGLNI
jgi:hypothetical protein